jgi:chromatin remodeling complex protein RSC6
MSKVIVAKPQVPVPDTPIAIETPKGTAKRGRQTPTVDGVMADYEDLLSLIEEEIKTMKTARGDTKFLKYVYKRVSSLKSHTTRIAKHPPKTPRLNAGSTGFQKPIKISRELAKFTGWPEDELRSRADVTKYICDYIARHDLQIKDDRRTIQLDSKLQKLLGWDSSSGKPFRYCDIQSCLKAQKHFPKDDE